jgi:hypothetical protein
MQFHHRRIGRRPNMKDTSTVALCSHHFLSKELTQPGRLTCCLLQYVTVTQSSVSQPVWVPGTTSAISVPARIRLGLGAPTRLKEFRVGTARPYRGVSLTWIRQPSRAMSDVWCHALMLARNRGKAMPRAKSGRPRSQNFDRRPRRREAARFSA